MNILPRLTNLAPLLLVAALVPERYHCWLLDQVQRLLEAPGSCGQRGAHHHNQTWCPAAMLIPIKETHAGLTHQEVVEAMRQLRKRVKPGNMSVREMISEGRRL